MKKLRFFREAARRAGLGRDAAGVETSRLMARCDEMAREAGAGEGVVTGLKVELRELRGKLEKHVEQEALSAAVASHAGSGGGGFDSKVLMMQVKQLQTKLTCNVCNEREKTTLLAKCNHMFCRECVDTRIENRDRKCPSCMIRFDKGDVKDCSFNFS